MSAQGTKDSNHGTVTSVRGSVVDVRFDDHLPPIYSLLRAGKDAQVAIEVLMQLDGHRVRGIALNPTQGFPPPSVNNEHIRKEYHTAKKA